MKKLHGIFGGNFDPIHYGHMNVANQLSKEIGIEKIIFVPNNYPPHRSQTKTSIKDKINMIKIAINHNDAFKISYLEAHNNYFCYTIDTLKKIRETTHHSKSLCFIIGEDNLEHFHLWKDWDKILLYSHLVICPRKHNRYQLTDWINLHSVDDYNWLYKKTFGCIFFSKISLLNASSTEIRKNYSLGKSCHALVPQNVNNYILLKKLYS